MGLVGRALSAAAYLALLGWLEPAVADTFDEFSDTDRILGTDPGNSVADQHLAFAGQLIVLVVTAYVTPYDTGDLAKAFSPPPSGSTGERSTRPHRRMRRSCLISLRFRGRAPYHDLPEGSGPSFHHASSRWEPY